MHIGKSYKPLEFIDWTRRDVYLLIVLGIVPVLAYQVGDQKWLGIPWTVVALLGTATAFIVGFKNLQTYNRAWEARQIDRQASRTTASTSSSIPFPRRGIPGKRVGKVPFPRGVAPGPCLEQQGNADHGPAEHRDLPSLQPEGKIVL